MSANKLAENEWGEILSHPREAVLELRWRSDVEMSDAAFMATLSLLAVTAERVLPSRILVDATHFRHSFGDGVMEWRNHSVIPRYGAAGVRRFAFVMPGGFPSIGQVEVDPSAVFPTAWFASRGEALTWLAGA